jgi:hypothetical protein
MISRLGAFQPLAHAAVNWRLMLHYFIDFTKFFWCAIRSFFTVLKHPPAAQAAKIIDMKTNCCTKIGM